LNIAVVFWSTGPDALILNIVKLVALATAIALWAFKRVFKGRR